MRKDRLHRLTVHEDKQESDLEEGEIQEISSRSIQAKIRGFRVPEAGYARKKLNSESRERWQRDAKISPDTSSMHQQWAEHWQRRPETTTYRTSYGKNKENRQPRKYIDLDSARSLTELYGKVSTTADKMSGDLRASNRVSDEYVDIGQLY